LKEATQHSNSMYPFMLRHWTQADNVVCSQISLYGAEHQRWAVLTLPLHYKNGSNEKIERTWRQNRFNYFFLYISCSTLLL